MDDNYKWVGDHAQDLADGRMLAPGETTYLSDEDLHNPHNESLIADGGLIPLDESAEHQATLAERRSSRRDSKVETPAAPGDQVSNPEKEGDS